MFNFFNIVYCYLIITKLFINIIFLMRYSRVVNVFDCCNYIITETFLDDLIAYIY